MRIDRSSPDIAALADEIEKSDGIYLMHRTKEIPRGYQFGIKKTAQVVAALRASQPATPTGGEATKSAPVQRPPHNSGERLPSGDAAGAGADTRSSAGIDGPLAVLVKQYAIDLRRNASGGDDYPYEYAKATADYLETLIKRAKGNCTCAQAGFPDSCDNCDGIAQASAGTEQASPWSASTHDEIIKRLMANVGMPNSISLYGAFKQFANELHALAHADVAQPSLGGEVDAADLVSEAWEAKAEAHKLAKLLKEGVECEYDDSLVTIFISDESNPSVGLDGGLRLSLSCNYEVIPVSLVRDIKRAMGDNWERCVDLWRQTYEASSISSTEDK